MKFLWLLIGSFIGSVSLSYASQTLVPTYRNDAECVRIYYDSPAGPLEPIGQEQAILLENLLGHFPHLQVISAPIESYVQGQLDQCRASFYIGNYYDNPTPQAFLDDYKTSSKTIVWMGYSIWHLDETDQNAQLGIRFKELSELDREHLDGFGRPTFFRNVRYKGQLFSKYGEVDANGNFNGDFEHSIVTTVAKDAVVLATISHNHTGRKTPYIVRKNERYFISDVPFSYIHESDRYLVFSDLLFDILKESPLRSHPVAVFRLEDVHARTSLENLNTALKIAREEGVPIHIATIPVYTDPFGEIDGTPDSNWYSIQQEDAFYQALKSAQQMGARFVWHGVTHQYPGVRNPAGAVADDFEFWDVNRDGPITEDGLDFVIDRLTTGWQSFSDAGIYPEIWETPHYRASAYDYVLFGRLFHWSIGRISYQPIQFTGISRSDTDLTFTPDDIGSEARKKALSSVSVFLTPNSNAQGQFFPYEIYRDYYGQSLFPENLGNVQDPGAEADSRFFRKATDIIRDAKRNVVLRDVWGSFYYHPHLLEHAKGQNDLRKILRALKEAGYEFITLPGDFKNPKPRVGLTLVPSAERSARSPTLK